MALMGLSMLSAIDTLGRKNQELNAATFNTGLTLRDLRLDIQTMNDRIGQLARSPAPLVVRRFHRDMKSLKASMKQKLQSIAGSFKGDPVLVEDLRAKVLESGPVLETITGALTARDDIAAYTLAKTIGANHVILSSMSVMPRYKAILARRAARVPGSMSCLTS